ncbi:MAG: hypothetical protein AB1631_20005 [Acidobacteriota bacterium]
MIAAIRKDVFSIICAAFLFALATGRAEAGEAIVHASFTNLSASGSFVKEVYVYTAGRITIDARWTPQSLEMKLVLRRPNGSFASQISGAGGNLTLSYTATAQEVSAAINANHIKWKIEAARSLGTESANGKLRIIHPWETIQILHNKQFKLGPPSNASVGQHTHSETFKVLAPGTIRIIASWSPQAMVSAFLAQNTIGAVIRKDTQGPFEVSHKVGTRNLNIANWTCAFQNLSRQAVLGKVTIHFIPDR